MRPFEDRDDAERRALGLKFYRWLISRPAGEIAEGKILHVGLPKAIRSKARRDAVLSLLEDHRLINRPLVVGRAVVASGYVRPWEAIGDRPPRARS
jgi:hypothetical protein